MAERFEVQIEIERFIHNDLECCALGLRDVMREKIESNERAGINFQMMGSLIFSAFAIEAKVNFVGWKVLANDWNEWASLRKKIDLLIDVLALDLCWEQRPLQTISELKRFRDTIAHGKPEIIDDTTIENARPDLMDEIKGQWEYSLTQENIDRCCEDMDTLWKTLLEAAKISVGDTNTRGGYILTTLNTE